MKRVRIFNKLIISVSLTLRYFLLIEYIVSIMD